MPSAHRIAVGEIEIVAVWDGTLQAKVESILELDREVAQRLIDAEMRAGGEDPLTLPVRAFLIRSRGCLALVDTGSGTTKGPTMGHLPRSLAELGVAADAIDSVLLTHLHMDHIGGLIDSTGQPAFPNAELVLHQMEARYFIDAAEEAIDERSRRSLQFVRKAVAAYGRRVRRVETGEGLDGISARLAPGHTPGHTCWEIRSGGSAAIVLGDVVHMGAVQLPLPATAMIYDVDGAQAARTRGDLLRHIADGGIQVAGAHLPAGGLGRFIRAGDGYRFQPADPSRGQRR